MKPLYVSQIVWVAQSIYIARIISFIDHSMCQLYPIQPYTVDGYQQTNLDQVIVSYL